MEKEYTAVFQIGITTDTWDTEGRIIEQKKVTNVGKEDLGKLLDDMKGIFRQKPPIYSAKKIRGRPSYYYARSKHHSNRDIVLKTTDVNIYSIELIDFDGQKARIRVRCSAGTYIRSLVYEIGKRLGFGATLTDLVRSKINGFNIENAIKVDDIERIVESEGPDRFESSIISCDRIKNAGHLKNKNRKQ
jgi:tRNA pseudouridine55 synthase